MRFLFIAMLTASCVIVTAQKIEYRNDSLFVNHFYVDAKTSRPTLDSLLGKKGKTKISRDKYITDTATGKKLVRETDFYYDLGLFFRRYAHDTIKFSVGIKLYRDTDRKDDRERELKDTFKGELYIAGNYINDKRTIGQLQQLKDCIVNFSYLSVGAGSYTSGPYLTGGDLVYKENIIRLAFDSRNDQLTHVFIHHNFKDR